MKTRLILAALAVSLGASAFADPMGSQATPAPGKWCSNFTATKAYADANNIPLIVFWASPSCHQCELMENALNKADFQAWQADFKAMMVFTYGASSTDQKDSKAFAKSGKDFPFMAVYWKRNTKGAEVYERFTGRTGKMGAYGASSKDTLQQQFMDAVENILPDWDGTPVDPVDPVDPDPVYYTVKFVVDANKGTAKGNLQQQVESGKGAVAPTVTANAGWKFSGWDKSFSKVTANLTVTAKFKVVSSGKPDPVDPGERDEVSAAEVYKKARSLSALVYGESGIVGTATLKLGKIASRTGKVKTTLSVKLFTGRSASASFSAVPNSYGDLSGSLPFKSTMGGAMDCTVYYQDGGFLLDAAGETYWAELGEADLGGLLETDELFFSADIDIPLADGWDFVVDPPFGEPVFVKNGKKLSFNKSPTIKFKKVDGEYELVGADDTVRTNYSGLKLTYTSSTGAFSGSFKVYCTNANSIASGKPKLKAYTVKVKGVVVNGAGVGAVTYSKYTGTCTLD